uniref:Geranylgeranyl pyrophosphate synthase n=2 Tax=Schistocephalus solidus TaxID=70667 RepID=A0A0X3PNH8_SCHSO
MSENESFKHDGIILEPFHYLLANSGKGLRRQLIKAFNFWMQIPAEKLELLSEVIEMLHNASLVIDDIEDGSSRRRGKPAAHMLFGIPMSINAANYAYFLALEKVLALGHPDVPLIFAEQMLDLHRGQGLDIYWRCSCNCPSEPAYEDMVIKKTGGLFGMAVKFMQLFSADKRDFTPLLEILGLWFQVRDDLANLVDQSYHDLKDFADDLTEGKFSYPVVHAINAQPHDHQVLSILRQRTSEYTVKEYCIGLLADMGSLDHTAKKLVKLETQCRNIVAELGGNSHLEAFLSEFSSIYRSPSGEPRTFEHLSFKGKNFSHMKPVSSGDCSSRVQDCLNNHQNSSS